MEALAVADVAEVATALATTAQTQLVLDANLNAHLHAAEVVLTDARVDAHQDVIAVLERAQAAVLLAQAIAVEVVVEVHTDLEAEAEALLVLVLDVLELTVRQERTKGKLVFVLDVQDAPMTALLLAQTVAEKAVQRFAQQAAPQLVKLSA